MDIGLQLAIFSRSSFLWTGIILAIFRIEGNLPVVTDTLLIMWAICPATAGQADLKIV